MSKYRLNIRFVMNQRGAVERKAVRTTAQRFANVVVNGVAIEYAKGRFEDVKAQLEKEIATAVRRELSYIASYAARYQGPKTSAQLTPRTGGSTNTGKLGQSVMLSTITPEWAPRSERYLDRKLKEKKHTRWFDYDGRLKKVLGNPDNWEAAFGPINVRFTRPSRLVADIKRGDYSNPNVPEAATTRVFVPSRKSDSTNVRVSIGRLEVSALGRITPQIIPSLVTGVLGKNYGDPMYLMALARTGWGSEIYWRLDPPGLANYRHLLEPFLAWYLARAVPNAVLSRVQDTIGGGVLR